VDWGVSLFPCFDEIVAGVPDLGRYLTLGKLEHSTDLLVAANPEIEVWSLCALVATRDRYRPARPRPAEPRTAR
jgi:hypothetical protein